MASKSGAKAKPKTAKPAIRLPKRNRGNPSPPPPPVEHQFKPGQSGNPSGRPKGAIILSKAYLAGLAELVPGDPKGRTYAELVATGQLMAAAKGNTAAAAEIRKATEGDNVHLDGGLILTAEVSSAIDMVYGDGDGNGSTDGKPNPTANAV